MRAIPQKKVAVKKKRQGEITELMSAKGQKRAERKIKNMLMDLDELSLERMKYVDFIMAAQDETVTGIVDSMVKSLQHMQGPPKLTIDGWTVNLTEPEFHLLQEIQDRNFQWIAVRCIVTCAEWGIRLGNFKAPTKACIRCGKKVTR